MRLTNFTDYALRMLMYAASAGDRLITIEETARAFNVSKTHLNKVASTLTRAGFLRAVRGRTGGLTLGRRPEAIRIGDVVRLTVPDFALVECFATGNQCVLTGVCRLSGVLSEAAAFITGSTLRVDGGVPNARHTWPLPEHRNSQPFNGFPLYRSPGFLE